jgi:hypothetical protein
MSKYKDVFNARKLENEESGKEQIQKSRQMEIQKDRKGKSGEKPVNLGIKVAEYRRRYWVGQAKLQGVTISEIIIGALSEKFGEPD